MSDAVSDAVSGAASGAAPPRATSAGGGSTSRERGARPRASCLPC